MIIYFRACEKQETISYVTRYRNVGKTELIKKCWISLQDSVQEEDRVILIVDEVSSETLNFMLETCSTSKLEIVQVPKHPWEIHQHTIVLFEVLEKYSELFPEELHYIVEDDYLHVPNSIIILEQTLKNWPYFATSFDYPDRYSQEETDKGCKLLLGLDRHWRTVNSAPLTMIAKGSTWLRHIDSLKLAAPTSNDKVFEEIFTNELCISPIPAISSHMTQKHRSPLVNWEALWDNIQL